MRSESSEKDIGTIISLEVISCVGSENAGLNINDAPVCSEVEDLAAQSGPGEVATNDRNGFSDASRSLSCEDGRLADHICCIEKVESWGLRLA